MIVSDAEILELFQTDRARGLRLLFERYYRPLVLYADEQLDSLPLAEDVVQEFFVRLWEDDYLCRLLPRALSSYLFTSVRNACYTQRRRKEERVRRVELEGVDVAAESAAEISQQIVDRVNQAIAQLPGQTAEVVKRILIQDMKYQEAAEDLHISVNTVKTLQKNGLKMLREELKEELLLLFYFFLKKKIH